MFLPNCRYRNLIKALIVIAVIVTFIALIFYARYLINKNVSQYQPSTATDAYRNINKVSVESESYLPKPNLKTILIIGLDIDGKIVSSQSYNNEYNADFLMLVCFDTENKTCKMVEINRDTVVDVQRLDIFGHPVDKQPMQICLSYSYGDGLSMSSNNTTQAVSDIFYGLNIDYTLVVSRDATRLAVEHIGGVEITMDNNYTDIDSSYIKGSTHILNKDQAMNFVSARYSTIAGTNTYRMQRQMCLINGLATNLQTSKTNLVDLYNSIYEYAYTNMDVAVLSKIVSSLDEYKVDSVMTPTGTSYVNYGYNELYLDDSSVKGIAQEVFFDKI